MYRNWCEIHLLEKGLFVIKEFAIGRFIEWWNNFIDNDKGNLINV